MVYSNARNTDSRENAMMQTVIIWLKAIATTLVIVAVIILLHYVIVDRNRIMSPSTGRCLAQKCIQVTPAVMSGRCVCVLE